MTTCSTLMNTTTRNEIMKRLNLLKLNPLAVNDLEQGILYCSTENVGIIPVTEKDWLLPMHQIENRYDMVMYHAIHGWTHEGEVVVFLYVDDTNKDKVWWQDDHDKLAAIGNGQAKECFAYTLNLTHPDRSGFGNVRLKRLPNGVLSTM